jgi:capsular polysaccharide biosynthesis protein
MAVPNRPCRLMPCSPKPRFEVVDNSIYSTVIEKLKSEANWNLSKHRLEQHSRIFLMRDSKRIASEDIQNQLCSELQGLGFHCIYPEEHSFSEQIQFLSKATVIAGFAGSQLHNSIFGPRDSLVIEIGDQRSTNQPQIFQELCADIAQNFHQHISYSADPEKIASDIKDLIR